MLTGRIKFYSPRLGWGIVETPDNTGYFMHGTDYDGGVFPGPIPGEHVQFEMRRTEKGRRAVLVTQVKQ